MSLWDEHEGDHDDQREGSQIQQEEGGKGSQLHLGPVLTFWGYRAKQKVGDLYSSILIYVGGHMLPLFLFM
jgi:hypothetical protein